MSYGCRPSCFRHAAGAMGSALCTTLWSRMAQAQWTCSVDVTQSHRLHQPLYNRKAWPRIRARQLAQEPLCRMCKEIGIDEPATVADHIIPHKGDWALFFDAGNIQSLCSSCHNSVKQRIELGTLNPIGVDGWPV
jgi:5-methylcytosine-specific restriction protein A